MRVLLAAGMVVMLASYAFAQQSHVPAYREEDKEKTMQQKAADKAAQDAYQKSLNNIPDKGPTDPWGSVRSTDAPKPVATTEKPKKTKTGRTDTKP